MNFMKDPQYSSIRMILLVVVIAAVGAFAYKSFHNDSDLNSGKVIPDITQSDGGVKVGNSGGITTAYDFAAVCADGLPHVHVKTPNMGDYKISSNLSVTWESCNVGNDVGVSGQVKISLVPDTIENYWLSYPLYSGGCNGCSNADHHFSVSSKILSEEEVDDGSYSHSPSSVLGGLGGYYKVKLELSKGTKVDNGADPGDYDIVYDSTGATDDSDSFVMIYEDDSYLQTTGTKTFSTSANLQFFRAPKFATQLIFTETGGGGGGGGAGGISDNGVCGGGGGGGGQGQTVTGTIDVSTLPYMSAYHFKNGQMLSIGVGSGGAGGAAGQNGVSGTNGQKGGKGGNSIFNLATDDHSTATDHNYVADYYYGTSILAGGGNGGGGGSSNGFGGGGIGGTSSSQAGANGKTGLGGNCVSGNIYGGNGGGIAGAIGSGGKGGSDDETIGLPGLAGVKGSITFTW